MNAQRPCLRQIATSTGAMPGERASGFPSNELAPAFRCRSLRSLFLGCRFEVLAYCIPVYDIPNCFQIIRPAILVLEVVGVFPNVDTKHRL
jgi:hypothetical protein